MKYLDRFIYVKVEFKKRTLVFGKQGTIQKLVWKKEGVFMKRLVLLTFIKTLVITVGCSLIYVLYGLISDNPFKITLEFEIIFFLVIFFTSLIEYVWENRKK